MKVLTRKGFLIEEQGMTYLADTDPDTALGPLRAAACTYRIALGPRAGQKVLSLQTVPTREPPLTPVCCVDEQGFRQWVSRIARSKGLNIFMWIWAIITILTIGMSWFGSRPDPLSSGATPHGSCCFRTFLRSARARGKHWPDAAFPR
jgi:hypothetical protein